jgi:hypothetical protein
MPWTPSQNRTSAPDARDPHSLRGPEAQIGAVVEHYNHCRYHVSISGLAAADVYFKRRHHPAQTRKDPTTKRPSIDARYSTQYEITTGELCWFVERIKVLQTIVDKVRGAIEGQRLNMTRLWQRHCAVSKHRLFGGEGDSPSPPLSPAIAQWRPPKSLGSVTSFLFHIGFDALDIRRKHIRRRSRGAVARSRVRRRSPSTRWTALPSRRVHPRHVIHDTTQCSRDEGPSDADRA